jgi:hypothetical protein
MNWASIELRLAELAALKKGWDSYGADPPSAAALSSAQFFLFNSTLHFAYPAKVNPSVIGGVGVTYRAGAARHPYVYIEFQNAGSTLALWVPKSGAGKVRVERLGGDLPAPLFHSIRDFVCPPHTAAPSGPPSSSTTSA